MKSGTDSNVLSLDGGNARPFGKLSMTRQHTVGPCAIGGQRGSDALGHAVHGCHCRAAPY